MLNASCSTDGSADGDSSGGHGGDDSADTADGGGSADGVIQPPSKRARTEQAWDSSSLDGSIADVVSAALGAVAAAKSVTAAASVCGAKKPKGNPKAASASGAKLGGGATKGAKAKLALQRLGRAGPSRETGTSIGGSAIQVDAHAAIEPCLVDALLVDIHCPPVLITPLVDAHPPCLRSSYPHSRWAL